MKDYLSLEEMVSVARDVAGAAHHFRFVQLPFNLAMPQALTLPNQMVNEKAGALVQAARSLGITVVSSAALLQGHLIKKMPAGVEVALGLKSNLLRALQFARSTPGITTALTGMSKVAHVRANLEIVGVEPAAREQYLKVFENKA